MRLQIIGGGKMGEALLGGVVASGWAAPDQVAVVEVSEERRVELGRLRPGVFVSDAALPAVDAVIAVKPNHVAGAADALAVAGVGRMLSIAAGIRIAEIEAVAPDAVVIRCMPNTPALVGRGASAIAGGRRAGEEDMAWGESILRSVGMVVRVDESQLDAVTGLSGSGPAYFFRFVEALIAAGIAQGLDHEVADGLARQTILGAAELLHQSGEDPGMLRENVTSPGGTTEAGLAVLDAAEITKLVAEAVAAATHRSRELGSN